SVSVVTRCAGKTTPVRRPRQATVVAGPTRPKSPREEGMRFRGFIVAAMGVLAVAPLAAQKKGQIEIGGFGRYTGYPDSYIVQGPDDNRLGAGGRLGYFLSDHLGLEVDGSFNPTDLAADQPNVPSTIGARSRPLMYNPWNLRGVYNFGSG